MEINDSSGIPPFKYTAPKHSSQVNPSLISDGITIPSGAFNLMEDTKFGTAIRNLILEANRVGSPLHSQIGKVSRKANWRMQHDGSIKSYPINLTPHINNIPTLEEHKDFLKRMGSQIDLRGKVAYYPLGGMDFHTPFLSVDGLEDLLVISGDQFGRIDDVATVLADPMYLYVQAGLNYVGFDPMESQQDRTYQKHINANAAGAVGISRIVAYLGGEIQGVYSFGFSEDKKLLFKTKEQINKEKEQLTLGNVVIEFNDPKTGQEKRVWYLPSLMLGTFMGRNAVNLIDTTDYSILFLKGHLDLDGRYFMDRDNSETVDYFITGPTKRKRNEVTVVSDRSIPSVVSENDEGPLPPFYRKTPNELILQNGEVFGYSAGDNGDSIYYGNARDLL